MRIVLAREDIEGEDVTIRTPCHGKAMWQALRPGLEASAFAASVTEFGDLEDLLEIVGSGRFDRRGFLVGWEKRIAKRWLVQKMQKIGHVAPTARPARRAQAVHDPVRRRLAPELVAFGLDAGHPVDDGAPHRFGDVDAFGIARCEWQ